MCAADLEDWERETQLSSWPQLHRRLFRLCDYNATFWLDKEFFGPLVAASEHRDAVPQGFGNN